MGMRLVKNISPANISVSISIQKKDGEFLSFSLNKGESVLVHDTEVATKPLIVQKRKGNIDILEYNNVANQLNLYQVYPPEKEMEVLDADVVDSEFQNPFENDDDETELITSENILVNTESVMTESENVIMSEPTEPVKNKGGRPKGSVNKKKKKKKKSKSKNESNTPNAEIK